MISYDKTWLQNLIYLDAVDEDYRDGLVPENEWKAVQGACGHGFYTPNLFIRVGLFFLTLIASSCSAGFLSLMIASADLFESAGWPLFLGIVHYAALEFMVREKHHYRSGVDDALLWIASGFLLLAFVMATKADEHPVLLAGFVCVTSALLSLRFADALMSLICYVALLATIFFGWQQIGALGNATMPFVMMLVSGVTYLLLRKVEPTAFVKFYTHCIILLQVAALLSFYAAGNYLVVKELNDMLNGTVSKSIPFGWFFWGWTVGMPLIYLFYGVKQKNTVLLRTGMVLIAAAATTYKAYYKLMPIELTLILCGTLALVISYLVTRYLKTPKNGFTYKQLRKDNWMEELNLESLLISESFAETGVPPVETGVEFGGGEFGGGGATGSF